MITDDVSVYDQIFNSTLEYDGKADEYVTLPKECFKANSKFTFCGVVLSDIEDIKALQKALTAGYRPKNNSKYAHLHKVGMDYSKILIRSFAGVIIFTLISLIGYTYFIDLSSLNIGVRIWIVLAPIYLMVIIATILTLLACSTNNSINLKLKYKTISHEEIISIRHELFILKKYIGETKDLLNMFYYTTLLDEAKDAGDDEKYQYLKGVLMLRMGYYKNSYKKKHYTVKKLNKVGGVPYQV